MPHDPSSRPIARIIDAQTPPANTDDPAREFTVLAALRFVRPERIAIALLKATHVLCVKDAGATSIILPLQRA